MINFKKLGIVATVAILFFALVLSGVALFYKEPRYNDFCDEIYPRAIPVGEVANQIEIDKEQEYFNSCNRKYEDALNKYSINLFLIVSPIAIIAILLGLFVLVDYLGLGFMFSGIVLMIYATARSFGSFSELTRFLVLLVELALVILISWKKIGFKSDKKWKTKKS